MTVFFGGLNTAGLIGSKQEKIEKVTSSRDDNKERSFQERAIAEPRRLSKPIWTGLKFSRLCGTNFQIVALRHGR
jgi:hypothetical protein